MTAAQAKRIIAAALPLKSLTIQGAVEIVRYHLKRNDIAYKSHRERAIDEARALGINSGPDRRSLPPLDEAPAL